MRLSQRTDPEHAIENDQIRRPLCNTRASQRHFHILDIWQAQHRSMREFPAEAL
jgi:hypothetical protein